MTDYQSLAREAAIESYGALAVGEFSGVLQEGQDDVITYLFKSKIKGYPDWSIAVTLFVSGWEATVSEVVLAPGDASLVAPKWVPWSERLADYKALQAALEEQAALAAAAAAEEEPEDADDDIDDVDDVDDPDEASEPAGDEAEATEPEETESALADVPDAVEAKDDADATGGKSKGLFKWKTLRGNKKRK